jgi:hypothetical protein
VKGLLYAGTERDVYVSFNDGDDWLPLTLNLPHSSVRDLIVHGDDLAVATHGRGFWILDNITPLRELVRRSSSGSRASEGGRSFLFKPQTAYRLRRNQNTDTPLPPEFPAGQNPPNGAILDYYLAADAQHVTLEVFTSSGAPVRRYSSDDKPEVVNEKDLTVTTYWLRPPQVLSTTRGMHRFVWDLRYPTPGAVQRDLPISAIYRDTPREPLGVIAVPGSYTVKLTIDGTSSSFPLTLKMDPRATITAAGLSQQFALATKLVDLMNRTYAPLSGSQPLEPALRAALAAVNTDLATAYDAIESTDRAPTTQIVRTVADLEQRVARLLR